MCAALATAAEAVPDLLDHCHDSLEFVYRNFVRQESRIAANKQYTRTVVRYDQLKGNAIWKEYIRQLAYVDPILVRESPEAARKAFWINAYNSFVMDAVATNYPLPIASVNDYPAGSFRGSAAWSAPHYVAGATYTLDSIRPLLADFRDPRVFFAISDAAIGSPALPDKPYDATNVEMELDRATTNFLADPLNYRIDRQRNKIVLSEIFRSNAQVFRDSIATISPDAGRYPMDLRAVVTFILPRVSQENRDTILKKKPAIEFERFNWELNLAQ